MGWSNHSVSGPGHLRAWTGPRPGAARASLGGLGADTRRLVGVLGLVLVAAGCRHDLTRLAGDSGDLTVDSGPDACAPTHGGVEICDGLDNDCNGQVDDGIDLSSDINNCGVCGKICSFPHAAKIACQASHCTFSDCERDSQGFAKYWDNDGKEENGCEYQCMVSQGGHEVKDAQDNDCDGSADEQGSSLTLLYRFDDFDTMSPKVTDRSGLGATGQAQGGTTAACGLGLTVTGEGTDRCAVQLDGQSGLIRVDKTVQKALLSCDQLAGWGGGTGNAVALNMANQREGSAALQVTHTLVSVDGTVVAYSGPLDFSGFIDGTKGTFTGYLSLFIYVSDPTLSLPKALEIGEGKGQNAQVWSPLALHVIGPRKGAFTAGWNLVALPLSAPDFTVGLPQAIKTHWLSLSTAPHLSPTPNIIMLDDIRVLHDLNQRFSHFTIMLWIRPAAPLGKFAAIASKQIDQPGLRLSGDGVHFWFSTHAQGLTATGYADITPTPLVAVDRWTHLAMTYNGSVVTSYIDGKETDSQASHFIPGDQLLLGGDGQAGAFFKGSLDEVAVYNSALSSDEIKRYYALFTP